MPTVNIFRVEKDHIKLLNDEQARKLVAKLCKAECEKFGHPSSSVTWGGDQRAADGGVDVRVKLGSDASRLNFIPSGNTVFQVKAERFPPSKIPKEVAPKGKPRAVYAELKSLAGAYVIVSTKDDCSDEKLIDRRDKINEVLGTMGYRDAFGVEFYCASKIADWVAEHPAIGLWVKNAVNQPISGWRDYGPWAYKEISSEAEYLIDDQVRVLVPRHDQSVDTRSAIERIRESLKEQCSIRIVGLSGVGKTRMVQALFDDRVFPHQPIPSTESVIYCDLADHPSPAPGHLIEQLLGMAADNILVVDNCKSSEHQLLTEKILKPGHNLKLITIEYDIREEDLADDTEVYRLEGASDTLIRKILERNFPILSEIDAEKIARFGGGNARVALALANTATRSGEFAQLKDGELFDRLFYQKKGSDENLLRTAEAASLLYSFNFSDEDETEVDLLASLAECSSTLFRRHIEELRRRGLVQSRGVWRAVLPQAISNRLAARAVDNINSRRLMDSLYESASYRVAKSFSRRLGSLHDNERAKAFARKLYETRLSDITTFRHDDLNIFVNLAPLCPELALNLVGQIFNSPTFSEVDGIKRRACIRLCRLIAYDPELFDSAVAVLSRFHLFEAENGRNDGSKNVILGLFQINFSETHALADQRIKVAQKLLGSSNTVEQNLGVDVVRAGLKTSDFSVSYDFEFGAHPRNYGWRPNSLSEVAEWFKSWLEVARLTMLSDSNAAQLMREAVAHSLRGLWKINPLQAYLIGLVDDTHTKRGWPECWFAVKEILRRDVSSMSDEARVNARALERQLRPADLVGEIRTLIVSSNREIFEVGEIDSNDLAEAHELSTMYAKEMGRKIANDSLLNELLPEFLTARNNQVINVGRGIGKESTNPQVVLDTFQHFLRAKDGQRNNLGIICGVIEEWSLRFPADVEKYLDYVLNDETWAKFYVQLQVSGPKSVLAYKRLLNSIQDTKIDVHQYRALAYGRATDQFTVKQLFSLINALKVGRADSFEVILELMWMIIHCSPGKEKSYIRQLKKSSVEFLKSLDWDDLKSDGITHHLEDLLAYALANCENEDAHQILSAFLENERKPEYSWRVDRNGVFKNFLQYFPLMTLDLIHQPDSDGDYSFADRIARESLVGDSKSILAAVPTKTLIEWCEASPIARYPYMAKVCQLFNSEEGSDASRNETISDVAVQILSKAPDRNKIVKNFTRRFDPVIFGSDKKLVLEQRLALIESLNPLNDPDIASALNPLREGVNKLMEDADTRDGRTFHMHSESFE